MMNIYEDERIGVVYERIDGHLYPAHGSVVLDNHVRRPHYQSSWSYVSGYLYLVKHFFCHHKITRCFICSAVSDELMPKMYIAYILIAWFLIELGLIYGR